MGREITTLGDRPASGPYLQALTIGTASVHDISLQIIIYEAKDVNNGDKFFRSFWRFGEIIREYAKPGFGIEHLHSAEVLRSIQYNRNRTLPAIPRH